MNAIGPQLPPHLAKQLENENSDSSTDENTPNSPKNPDLYGPSLPPNLYGPSLPPNFSKNKSTIGPALPPGFVPKQSHGSNYSEEEEEDSYIGPSLSESASATELSKESIAADFERRSEKMKNKLTNTDKDDAPKREEWMTELPNIVGNKIGLGARTFNKRAGPAIKDSDRSGWTETPLDKKRKSEQDEVEEEEKQYVPTSQELSAMRKNEELAEKLDKFNEKSRNESLMDQHRKKLKNEKKKSGEKETRREFDRDKDLNAKQVDKAFTKSIADKAKLFNSRFSHGSNHFL